MVKPRNATTEVKKAVAMVGYSTHLSVGSGTSSPSVFFFESSLLGCKLDGISQAPSPVCWPLRVTFGSFVTVPPAWPTITDVHVRPWGRGRVNSTRATVEVYLFLAKMVSE